MIEERKAQRIQAAIAAQQQLKAGDEEDSNQILESHLNRVMESPRGQNTPPHHGTLGSRRRPPHGYSTAAVTDPFYNVTIPTSSYDVINSPRQQRAAEMMRRRKEDISGGVGNNILNSGYDSSSNIGHVPGILSNKVPDVPTPVSLILC